MGLNSNILIMFYNVINVKMTTLIFRASVLESKALFKNIKKPK